MTNPRTLATLVVVLGMIVLLSLAGTSPAVAQNDTNQTTVVEDLGDLRVHSYEYVDGEMHIDVTWQGDRPTWLTSVELIELDQAGSTEISFRQIRLPPGDPTRLTMSVEERSGGTAAVMLTTSQSIEAGNALVLQAGDPSDREPIPFNLATILIALAAIGGAGASFSMTRRHYQDDEDDPRRERIA